MDAAWEDVKTVAQAACHLFQHILVEDAAGSIQPLAVGKHVHGNSFSFQHLPNARMLLRRERVQGGQDQVCQRVTGEWEQHGGVVPCDWEQALAVNPPIFQMLMADQDGRIFIRRFLEQAIKYNCKVKVRDVGNFCQEFLIFFVMD